MHLYRTHTCGELGVQHAGETVRLSGWIHRKRNHKDLLFIDLRDHYGITQLVMTAENSCLNEATRLPRESVITITGPVVRRDPEAINPAMATGEIEVRVEDLQVESVAQQIPFAAADDIELPEATRLTYRFLDLRRKKIHENMVLRSKIISSIRRRMVEAGFLEYQTPILTSSSPEGARDFLVPSRLHPGQFYALPQAPQQFKQLLMVAGFDRYFQIAPCFRDEDARADRSPGEFYQLDLEMSYVEQDDVFAVVEQLLYGLFREFSDWEIAAPPFTRLTYADAMLRYGSDKPDLRYGLEIADVSAIASQSDFRVFREIVEQGGAVRMLCAPDTAGKPRSFFDNLDRFIKEQGGKGVSYIALAGDALKGSAVNALGQATVAQLIEAAGAQPGATLFLVADAARKVSGLAGKLRTRLADELDLREKNVFRFCWIVDFPMYELNEETGQIEFSHNPFSMPQGGLEALESKDPLDILAFQYDIVCNGIELSSGAIRNHRPEIMYKAFEIAGYGPEVVDRRFGGMIRAFKTGAPPHGGIAPGVDRIVMLLADEPNIREVILFPMNQNAQDLMMGAPSEVSKAQLDELHIQLKLPPRK
jgi:aspartyl-tRNA synthetase